ncbi:hypothetical protein QPK31_17160 [Massilia sp. YIM B02769]|uniref:hypothetical protein n=1 Tax=Massilia sp. YIM B02769 TaxID=3050129 RepID=UPI0025B63925|nr:hypothetical protein [Massilia sp. YIM B02769]MDN4059948.1 hypothetical protein [Massilia sp. YIM B02769]
MTTFYRPSGRVPATLLPVFLLALLALLPLASAYVWLITRAPLVINVFLAFCYAGCVGILASVVAARAKVRNPEWMRRAGIVLALAAWYCQWAAWIAVTSVRESPQFAGMAPAGLFWSTLADPIAMARFMFELATSGSLHLGQWRVPAVVLALIWLGELGIHVPMAPALGRMRAQQPFCEASGAWAKEITVPQRFAPLDDEDVQALLDDPAGLARNLHPVPADAADYAEVLLYRCQEKGPYLSIIAIATHEGERGRSEQKKTLLFEYLRLDGVDLDALLARWAAAGQGAQEQPVPPALAAALAHLQDDRYAEALAAAAAHTGAADPALRADALRICAIACSRLARWSEALAYWRDLFGEEDSAHNALQVATSAVMAGQLALGVEWIDTCSARNASTRDMPAMQILTAFVTALGHAGERHAAMPYLEQIRQLYADLGNTDSTFLHLRGLPFFSAFLANTRPFVHAVLGDERGREWYAALGPSLDAGGRQELDAWLQAEFGEEVPH